MIEGIAIRKADTSSDLKKVNKFNRKYSSVQPSILIGDLKFEISIKVLL